MRYLRVWQFRGSPTLSNFDPTSVVPIIRSASRWLNALKAPACPPSGHLTLAGDALRDPDYISNRLRDSGSLIGRTQWAERFVSWKSGLG